MAGTSTEDVRQDTSPDIFDEESRLYQPESSGCDSVRHWEADASRLINAIQSLSTNQAFEDICNTFAQVDTLRSLVRQNEQKLEAVRRESSTQEEAHKRSIRDLLANYHTLRNEADVKESNLEQHLASLNDRHKGTTADLDTCRKNCAALQETIDRLYAELQEQKQACAANCELIESLKAALEERNQRIECMQKDKLESDDRHEKAQKSILALEAEKASLALASGRLAGDLKRFTDYVHSLKNLDLDDCAARMESVWEELRDVIFKNLNENVPDSTLKATEAWQRLRKATGLPPEVPMLPSNSHSAKNMRVVAVLGLAARCISDQIFSPSYLFEEEEEIRNFLATEALRSPERERLLRGLLATISDEREISGSDVVDRVVREIAWSVASIATSAQEEDLKRELRPVIVKAMRLWSQIQKGKQKLESSVNPGLLAEHGVSRALPLQNEAAVAPASGDDDYAQDDLVIVFPSIFHLNEQGFCCIFNGYSLKREQTRAALAEADDARATMPASPKSLSSLSRRPSAAARPPQKTLWASFFR